MGKLFSVVFLSIIFGLGVNRVFACIDILFVVDTSNEELSRDRAIQIAKTIPDDQKIRRWVVLSRNDRYVPRVVRNNYELVTVLSSVTGNYDRFLEVASSEIARRTETFQPFVILLFSETPVNETMTQIWRMISKAPALHIFRIGSNKKREILSEHEKTDFEQLLSCGRNRSFVNDNLRFSSKFNGNEIRRKPTVSFSTTTYSTHRPYTSTRDPQVRKLTFYDPSRTLLEEKPKNDEKKLTYIRTFKKYTSTRPPTTETLNTRNPTKKVFKYSVTKSTGKYTTITTKIPPKSTMRPTKYSERTTNKLDFNKSRRSTTPRPTRIYTHRSAFKKPLNNRASPISEKTTRNSSCQNRNNPWVSSSSATRKTSSTTFTTKKPYTTKKYTIANSSPFTTSKKRIKLRATMKNDADLISTTLISKNLVTRRPSFSPSISSTTSFPLLQTLAEPPKKEEKMPQDLLVRSRFVQFAVTEKPLTTTSQRPTRPTTTTQTTTKAPKVPSGCVVDVYFLVDLSQGTGDKSQQYLDIAASTINAMPISKHAVRVGLISYSGPGRTQVHVYLDKHSEKEDLIEEMFLMERHGGTTRTADAIRYAVKTFDDYGHPARRHAKKVLVVFTDGFSHDDPKEAARIARARGIQVVAVAVKDKLASPDEQQLSAIGGNSQNFLISPSGRLLREKILSNQCRL